jgi:hypothetical protein
MRLALCPLDGRVYECGGDYPGKQYSDSGRNEIWSCDPRKPNVWRLEYPYEGFPGDVQPAGPDEVAWTWDSRRKVFWMVPGFQYGDRGLPLKAKQLGGHLCTFDPQTRKWTDRGPADRTQKLARVGFGHHVAITDEIHRFAWHGAAGMVVAIYNCETGREEIASMRIPGNNDRLNAEYAAFDGERMWAVSHNLGRLIEWDVVKRSAKLVAQGLPTTHPDGRNMIFWAPGAARLEFYHLKDLIGFAALHLIDPVSGGVERVGETVDGITLRANAGVHVPGAGTLLIGGSMSPPTVGPPTQILLYTGSLAAAAGEAPARVLGNFDPDRRQAGVAALAGATRGLFDLAQFFGGWARRASGALIALGAEEALAAQPPQASRSREAPRAWESIKVNPHARVVPIFKDPAATDRAQPATHTFVPWRAYSHAVMGRDGILYYHGGAHGDYPGNEVDWFDTRTQRWTQGCRPHVPPPDDPMWGSGGSGNVWYAGREWQPYSIHGYGRQSWLPDLGYCFLATGVVGWNADGTPQKAHVLCAFDRKTAEFSTHGHPIRDKQVRWLYMLSEYDDAFRGLLAFGSDGHRSTVVSEFRDGEWRHRHTLPMDMVTARNGEGGSAIHYLEQGRHLLLRMPQAGGSAPAVFLYDGETARQVSAPPDVWARVGPSGNLFAAVDRTARRVFFGQAVSGTLALWAAGFDELGSWAPIPATNAPAVNQSGSVDRMPLHFHGGNLYVLLAAGNGWRQGIALHRLPI